MPARVNAGRKKARLQPGFPLLHLTTMTRRTLSQAVDACLDLALDLLTAAPAPMTMDQIIASIRSQQKVTAAEIRAAVASLVEDELLDTEQLTTARARVYFIPSRPPRGAILTPACKVPRIAPIAPHQWFSPLGLAA